MASEHEYPVPRSAPHSPLPPPPPPPPPRLQLQTPQTSPLRRIAVQPPLLTTALAPPQGASFLHGHQTPVSAVSLNVPFSPYAPSPSTYAASPVSSPMTMRNASSASVPYNPQQWGRNAAVGGQYAPHLTQTPTATGRPREITGMEGNLNSLSSEVKPPRSASRFISARIPPESRISSCSKLPQPNDTYKNDMSGAKQIF